MRAKVVDNFLLTRWRSLDAATVLLSLADYAKPDPTFQPLGDPRSKRWHVSAGGREFEFILTGPKFYNTRTEEGGGGAIDLVEHLYALPFKKAVALLKDRNL